MGESRRAVRSSTDTDAHPSHTRTTLPLVLGGIGLLIVGGIIGAAITGGLSLGGDDPVAPSGPTSSAPPAVSSNSSATAGVPLAGAGSQLTTVTSPPPRTLTYVTMDEGAKVSYDVTFAPYGFAPSALGENRLVIQIMKAQRTGEGVDVDLAGMNAVVALRSATGSADITAGGTYQGVIEVRHEADGRGALFLTEVRPAP